MVQTADQWEGDNGACGGWLLLPAALPTQAGHLSNELKFQRGAGAHGVEKGDHVHDGMAVVQNTPHLHGVSEF